MRTVLQFSFLVVLLLQSGMSLAVGQSYSLADLGVLGNDEESRAWGMNARGQVVGWSRSGSRLTAFVHSPGSGMTSLGTLPGKANSAARSIDDAGIVVGSSWAATINQPGTAFRWHPVLGMQDLSTLGGATSEAMAIGGGGVIVGTSATSGPNREAFVLPLSGAMQSLTPGALGEANAVSADGRIGGASNGQPRFWSSSFVMSAPATLPGLPRGAVQAFARSGLAAGVLTDPSGTNAHVATWNGSSVRDLGLVGRYSMVGGVASDGTVVGTYQTSFSVTPYGFVVSPGSVPVDVNTRIVGAAGWRVTSIFAVNDLGQMAANARDASGRRRAVRLDPVVSTPAAAVTRRGEGCSGSGLVPELWCSSPSIATGFVAGVRDGAAQSVGLLAASPGTAPRAMLGAGCSLWIDVSTWFEVVQFTTDISGRFELPFSLSGIPGLQGAEIALQAFVVDPLAPLGVSFSNGLQLRIGS